MFKIEIDKEIYLELIDPTQADDIFEIVTRRNIKTKLTSSM